MTSQLVALPEAVTRRGLLGGLGGLAVAGTLAGCGGGAGTSAAGADPGFPVSIKHKFGTTTIARKPRRVIAIGTGSCDIDALVALGVAPVGVSRDESNGAGVFPWLKEKIDLKKTQLLSIGKGVDFEKVAALRPDLILATTHFKLAEDYRKLSQIAPTIGYLTGWGTDSWQDLTRLAGKAVGLPAVAETAIRETEAAVAAAAKRYALTGKTFTASVVYAPDVFTLVSQADFAVKFFVQLGMRLPASIDKVRPAGGGKLTGQLSMEQLDLLDADLLIVGFPSPAAKNHL
ncbi:ABC transporter substrate-binding protein [Fodinicola feengrottensis]|uniref:ABC transporter substrate-binding protein n=1 Tax=Fodinicola feengrottensis TaxID=435914 RepID=UPI0013D32ABF|nr:ABC transporter substrate-binding protein [Fodinicola feengrottensis]